MTKVLFRVKSLFKKLIKLRLRKSLKVYLTKRNQVKPKKRKNNLISKTYLKMMLNQISTQMKVMR
jgi:hypothetical protein